MQAEDEYRRCVNKLEECVAHLKEFNRRLLEMGKHGIPMEDIFTIESSVEDLQHDIENKIQTGEYDEKI